MLGWPSYGIAPNSQVRLRVAGKKHRVTFVAPRNAPEVMRAGDGATIAGVDELLRAAAAVRTYPAGMKTGAAWRARLSPDDSPS